MIARNTRVHAAGHRRIGCRALASRLDTAICTWVVTRRQADLGALVCGRAVEVALPQQQGLDCRSIGAARMKGIMANDQNCSEFLKENFPAEINYIHDVRMVAPARSRTAATPYSPGCLI